MAFHSPPASVGTMRQGNPLLASGGADGGKELAGHWDKGALCWRC